MIARPIRRPALALAAPSALLGILAIGACSSSGVGFGVCRQVEEALCREAPACNVPLPTPVYTSGTDVEACIQYYDDQCLHGLQVGNNPPAASVNACVDAIQNAAIQKTCSFIITSPQNSPACAWLIPASAADASNDVVQDSGSIGAADSSSDASSTE